MTAELTELDIDDLRREWGRGPISDEHFHALCEMALRDVRARGQKPVAWRHRQRGPSETEWQEWRVVGYKPQGPESPRFEIAPLFASPQPTCRDGLLAAAKWYDDEAARCSSGAANYAWQSEGDGPNPYEEWRKLHERAANTFRALAEKEG